MERLVIDSIEGNFDSFAIEHINRYKFARNFIKDNFICLDIACGCGYGSSILSQKAKKLVGIDLSCDAIKHSYNYFLNEKILFIQADCLNIPIKDNSIDTIVSFETFEHLSNYKEFLKEVYRCLKNNGLLILSTPNIESNTTSRLKSEFHIREFTLEELKSILSKYFSTKEVYQQSIVFKGIVRRLWKKNLRHLFDYLPDKFKKFIVTKIMDFFNNDIKRVSYILKPLVFDFLIGKEIIRYFYISKNIQPEYFIFICQKR